MGTLGGKPQGVTQLGGGLNRDAFNKMFSGTPLAGHADDVIEAARKNNISPSLMAGIMAHETGKGTSAMLRQKNNPAGLMHGNTGQSFATIGEGITAAGRVIGNNFRRGGGTIEGMAKSYAPVGAANDPGGLNRGWPAGVRRFTSQLESTGPATPPHFNVSDIRKSVMGAGAHGPGDTGTVPAEILAQARDVALESGPGGVEKFMRENGHPRSGAWCGEFAASVVTSVGGTPPKNPAIASNWRNWGTPTNTPVPGDIAVRRGVPTGSTGSHVTIFEGADEKSGTFTGLGGNQGRFESRMPISRYEFRHGEREKIEDAAKATKPIAEEQAARHGQALRDHFGHRERAHPDLLSAGQRAGLMGSTKHSVEGRAAVDISLNGFPRGTVSKSKTDGELFREVKLSRGKAMPAAHMDG